MPQFSFDYFEDTELPNLFSALKRTFDALDVPFYLIGARARDVWFLPERNIRITRDVDWVVATNDDTIFKNITKQLIDKEGFKHTTNPYTLLSTKGTQIDLLPLVETKGGSLEGLKEVFERGIEEVIFDEGITYQVATLPAIILLKIIAWDDRPEYRQKDLTDIARILEYAFDYFAEDIYDNHNDLFEDRELEEIAAYYIGRKIKDILGNSDSLKKRVIAILTSKKEVISKHMVSGTEKPVENVVIVLQNLLDGVLE